VAGAGPLHFVWTRRWGLRIFDGSRGWTSRCIRCLAGKRPDQRRGEDWRDRPVQGRGAGDWARAAATADLVPQGMRQLPVFLEGDGTGRADQASRRDPGRKDEIEQAQGTVFGYHHALRLAWFMLASSRPVTSSGTPQVSSCHCRGKVAFRSGFFRNGSKRPGAPGH